MNIYEHAARLREWAEQTRTRRRVLVCIVVPIGMIWTFVEHTVLSWIEWARQWRDLLDEVREFWQ